MSDRLRAQVEVVRTLTNPKDNQDAANLSYAKHVCLDLAIENSALESELTLLRRMVELAGLVVSDLRH